MPLSGQVNLQKKIINHEIDQKSVEFYTYSKIAVDKIRFHIFKRALNSLEEC